MTSAITPFISRFSSPHPPRDPRGSAHGQRPPRTCRTPPARMLTIWSARPMSWIAPGGKRNRSVPVADPW